MDHVQPLSGVQGKKRHQFGKIMLLKMNVFPVFVAFYNLFP